MTRPPLLGLSLREAWYRPTTNGKTPSSENSGKWLNLNSFTAHVTRDDLINGSLFGITYLRRVTGRMVDRYLMATSAFSRTLAILEVTIPRLQWKRLKAHGEARDRPLLVKAIGLTP
ncbi:hypothetical protein V8E54_011069 [Elaphomyces granulatus]